MQPTTGRNSEAPEKYVGKITFVLHLVAICSRAGFIATVSLVTRVEHAFYIFFSLIFIWQNVPHDHFLCTYQFYCWIKIADNGKEIADLNN